MKERSSQRKERIKKLKQYGMKQVNIVVSIEDEIYEKYKEIMKVKYSTSVGSSIANYMRKFIAEYNKEQKDSSPENQSLD